MPNVTKDTYMPRRTRTLAVCACLAVLAVVAGILGSGSADPADAAANASRPNVVLIQTDDQTLEQLYATFTNLNGQAQRVMPHTLDLLGKKGITFNRYYASYPLCCPSRATLLSGRYAHSDGVISNDAPRGGYPSYQIHTINDHNLATYLQGAGYRTIHLGKFLNNYGGKDSPAETTVPPGWDDWETFATDNSTRLYYGYLLNVNGTIEGPFGDKTYDEISGKDDPGCPDFPPVGVTCNYSTDQFTARAVNQIRTSAPGGPFYMQVDYNAPHGDPRPPIGPEPPVRYYDSALSTLLPKTRAFNEGDVSDKPTFIRDAAEYLDSTAIRRIRIEYQKGIESLRGIDDGVGRIVKTLGEVGELNNTYIFFISDNGFFFGEHRLERAKFLPYEPAIHMPLLVRGPGIRPGSKTGELVANLDLAPTITQLASATADRNFDGRSMVRFWNDPSLRSRRPILLESFANATDIDTEGGSTVTDRAAARRFAAEHSAGRASSRIAAPVENYLGVRLGPYKYVEYETGDRELYNLVKDPNELNNQVLNPRYDRVQRFLKDQIDQLEGCRGRQCKYVTGPIPQPGKP